jgi:hypothetical protein
MEPIFREPEMYGTYRTQKKTYQQKKHIEFKIYCHSVYKARVASSRKQCGQARLPNQNEKMEMEAGLDSKMGALKLLLCSAVALKCFLRTGKSEYCALSRTKFVQPMLC